MTYASANMETLLSMLTYCRPAGSKTERRFIREFIRPLDVQQDKYGNLYKRIGDAPVLWSCHTDTVHKDGGMQTVQIQTGEALLPVAAKRNCLGADDTAGVWLMAEMIRAQRPGLYVFHRGEEHGGLGSSYIHKHTPELLAGINWAIALDRMGDDSVITHQMHRCCSDTFANALAGKLGGNYYPDPSGVFTDTAQYTDTIPECTNLSVGYYSQHTARERQDLDFIGVLREKLLALDVSTLPVVRKHTDPDAYGFSDDNGALGSPYGERGTYTSSYWDNQDYRGKYDRKPMSEIISDYPREVADILRSYGLSEADLIEELKAAGVLL